MSRVDVDDFLARVGPEERYRVGRWFGGDRPVDGATVYVHEGTTGDEPEPVDGQGPAGVNDNGEDE